MTNKEAYRKYLDAVIDDYERFQNVSFSGRTEIQAKMLQDFIQGLSFKTGNKYVKVMSGGSVHSFIVNTDKDEKFKMGDILKPANWKTPARNAARGNIYGDYSVNWTGPNYLR